MKIVHICITAAYIDNWGYQENLLPEYLSKFGTENHVITSNDRLSTHLNQQVKDEIIARGDSYKIKDVHIHKIRCKRVTSSMLISYGLMKELALIKPDVIFHHGINSTTLPIASKYAKNHSCRLFVDNHADEINMSKNKLWVLLYYKILSRIACNVRRKYFTKFYGVTRSRCDFINKYFGVNRKYIELLPIGADTDLADALACKTELRDKYGFSRDERIIVTGGKMGIHKGTVDLIKVVEELNTKCRIKLILFGKYEDDETMNLAKDKNFIAQYGWCDRTKTLELLKLSDVACWPIHHTTLNEDAIAVETPLIIRKTGTTEHLINGNGIWMENGNKDELKNAIEQYIAKTNNNASEYSAACKRMKEEISYNNIAKRIIECVRHN